MSDDNAKILFIESESQFIDSLRSLTANEEWDCHFATCTSDALTLLENITIDLIVADINSTDINHNDFIKNIYTNYPSTIRIFLTGQPKAHSTLKALASGYVQQIVPKPWNDQEFKDIIRSAIRQSKQQKKHSTQFQKLINSVPLLPMLPKSYEKIRSCTTNGEIDIQKMEAAIVQDAAISTILLHWANSALFGQRFHVDTIKKAIIIIGTDIVESLILSESINRSITLKLPNVNGFYFSEFKKHSMATAIIARLLIKSLLPTDFIQHDRAFISGLLHDIGKLVAANFFSSKFEKAIVLAHKNNIPLLDAEYKIFKTDHAELGAFIAEWWALPPFIVNAIRWTHQPNSSPIDQDVIIATNIANILSLKFGYGCKNEATIATIDAKYIDKFCLTDDANEILKAETDQIFIKLST